MQVDMDTAVLSDLRANVRGAVITPEDAGYDSARTVFLGGIDRKPAVIIRVADANDVAHVIRLASASGLELAVRGGGHSGAGHSATDGGIVLDLRAMKELDIDPESGTAWAEAGLTAREYTDMAGAHGLATGFGDTGSVGIAGLTLGGGVGFLARKYGLTIDDLLAAELVTADGRLRRVDLDHDPDLFWAIQGGGGNFGVVTRLHFRLHPVDAFAGGMLVLPATARTVAGFVEAAEAAPEELTAIANVMPSPPMPFVPEAIHGKLIVMATMAFVGGPDEAERVFAPFRALARPIADLLKPMRYPEIYAPDPEDYHPLAVSRAVFADSVDVPTAQAIVDRLEASDAPLRVAQLRVLGGAVARIPAPATAYPHRARRIMAVAAAFYEGPGDRPRRLTWASELADVIRQGQAGVYVNFLGDEGEARVREAYGQATWDRLAAIKRQYDPSNLFRLNQNIAPAGR